MFKTRANPYEIVFPSLPENHPPTPEEKRRVMKLIAAQAVSVDDCRDLLEMCGFLP